MAGTHRWQCLAEWCLEHEPCKRVSVQLSVVGLGGQGGGKMRRGEKLWLMNSIGVWGETHMGLAR